jgi:hypothetical protein
MSNKKILFLRGQVPQDRPKEQIMFDDLDSCDDMWTQLAHELSKGSHGEVWYWGGKRNVVYKEHFIERWIPNLKNTRFDFEPDVIFARGGFEEYDRVLKRNPQAYKIYYGAGFRRTPVNKFKRYDLILVDTKKQLKEARKRFPNIRVELFIKPAAENIFKPYEQREKRYDVIFVGNFYRKLNKGHKFAFKKIPHNVRMLSIGLIPKDVRKKFSHVTYTGWVPRKDIPKYYSLSKVAIICCGGEDSCPRVIPEAIACNCPILVLDRVNVWRKKYVTPETGLVSSSDNYINDLVGMLSNYEKFTPYEYYKKELSLEKSSKYILDMIND